MLMNTHDTNKSSYAKHLLDNRHTLRPMEDCMTILHTTVNGPMLNHLKTFYINNHKLNNKNIVMPNDIFEAVLHNNSDSTLSI
jgi:hypothetical protein